MIVPNFVFIVTYCIVYLFVIWYIHQTTNIPLQVLVLNERELFWFAAQLGSTLLIFLGVLALSICGHWPKFIPLSCEVVVMMIIVLFKTLANLYEMPPRIREKYGNIEPVNNE